MFSAEQEQQRLLTLTHLGLLTAESSPVFEEATQTAAHFLEAPICILGLLDGDRQWFKSATGLSRIGLMNDLARSRQLARQDAFCTEVVETGRAIVIEDTHHSPTSSSVLTQRYGIRAYLGVPLFAANGHCLGTLAVMDLTPRQFSDRDVQFLELMARWCISEYERNHLLQHSPADLAPPAHDPTQFVKTDLIAQMTQELRTPLTSVLGMASVLGQSVYGPLTQKQKEYIEVIRRSGQYLLSLVNEIIALGSLDERTPELSLASVDVEMLCQQALNTLVPAMQRREQELRITVEPGPRIWLLDKDKVRQMLYHLVFNLMQSSSTNSILRVHVSRRQNFLHIILWTSHPWLGEGLPQAELYSGTLTPQKAPAMAEVGQEARSTPVRHAENSITHSELDPALSVASRHNLGLLLSRHLAELHSGSIEVQDSIEEGHRYVVRLPQITTREGYPAKD